MDDSSEPLNEFLARRKMRRELEALAYHLAKQIRDSAADISPKHLHTGYEFGPVQQCSTSTSLRLHDAVIATWCYASPNKAGNGSTSVAAITQRSWPNENERVCRDGRQRYRPCVNRGRLH